MNIFNKKQKQRTKSDVYSLFKNITLHMQHAYSMSLWALLKCAFSIGKNPTFKRGVQPLIF